MSKINKGFMETWELLPQVLEKIYETSLHGQQVIIKRYRGTPSVLSKGLKVRSKTRQHLMANTTVKLAIWDQSYPPDPNALDFSLQTQVLQEANEGLTCKEISASLKIPQEVVHQFLKRKGKTRCGSI